MPKLADRVKETSTTIGTGTYSLGGAATGFRAFSAAFATSDTVYYCAEDGANWEVGIGTLTTGTPWTLARTTILGSSNAGAAVNWAAGTRNVFCTAPESALRAVGKISEAVLTTTTGAVTVDWTANNNYLQNEPTGAITYTFTAPHGPCHLQLRMASDGTSGAYTHIFPGNVIWLGSTWAAVANKKAIINFWYDGTDYYAMGANQV